MYSEIEVENLNKELNNLRTVVESLKNLLNNYEITVEILNKENDNLKTRVENLNAQITNLKTGVENLRAESTNLKTENDIWVQKSTNFAHQKRFEDNKTKFTDFFNKQLGTVNKVKANSRMRRKLFTIMTELLQRGEIPYDEIKQRFWKSKQSRARNLGFLRKLGYVAVKKKDKKNILILTPSGKNLEKQFELMLEG